MEYLKTLATNVINFICDILPGDGIQNFIKNLIMQGGAILTGLSWLNWFVDINAINLILDMWLLALGAYYVYKYGINIFQGGANVLKRFAGLNEDE